MSRWTVEGGRKWHAKEMTLFMKSVAMLLACTILGVEGALRAGGGLRKGSLDHVTEEKGKCICPARQIDIDAF